MDTISHGGGANTSGGGGVVSVMVYRVVKGHDGVLVTKAEMANP